jgi:hypothetical protein
LLEDDLFAEKEPTQKVIMFFASLGFVGIIVVPALDHRFRRGKIPGKEPAGLRRAPEKSAVSLDTAGLVTVRVTVADQLRFRRARGRRSTVVRATACCFPTSQGVSSQMTPIAAGRNSGGTSI